ncbi:hypothetical protein GOP47_0021582 [Adiantum capillus-veneris]|uniref:non-specific serine/threonine protein kinase n=1 Tax=Adiantum capillus-veneris TaxID=13818 RepID=A0A9D4U811_ADICA|nr:hypothetical protein GOP47_0021582 [Adiantum capillus-veneris]
MSESTASWPPPRLREHSRVFGMVNTLGSCFLPSRQTSEEQGTSLDDTSGKPFGKFLHEKSSGTIFFTIAELNKATDNFSPLVKIGQGGFGTVYKGKLKDGRLVAIKRAKKNHDDAQLSAEYCNELKTLSTIDHLNLVKFIGYAEEGPERILVVEYVTNGNLRQHLDGQFGIVLDLATRLDIAIDVAHAITYLHLYADQSIIHRDIKSTNILLTDNFRAKVSDFGFSRIGPSDFNATHVSTQVKGTVGYVDPEYLKTYQLTQKSDVYSFGVLLVELFTGRRPIEQKRQPKERITTKWAFQMYLDGCAIEALDSRINRSTSAYLMMEKVLELAFKCAASTREERPSMKKTAEMLWNIRKDYQGFWKDRPGLMLSKSGSQRQLQSI